MGVCADASRAPEYISLVTETFIPTGDSGLSI